MPESFPNNIEYKQSLPDGFEGIKNPELFKKVYSDISKWYGNHFDDTEKKMIKQAWSTGIKEYGENPDKKRIRIIENRIDNQLFEYKNPDLKELNKYIRKIGDADTQRNYRSLISRYLPINSQHIGKLLQLFKENNTPKLDSIKNLLNESKKPNNITFDNSLLELGKIDIPAPLDNLHKNYKLYMAGSTSSQENCFLRATTDVYNFLYKDNPEAFDKSVENKILSLSEKYFYCKSVEGVAPNKKGLYTYICSELISSDDIENLANKYIDEISESEFNNIVLDEEDKKDLSFILKKKSRGESTHLKLERNFKYYKALQKKKDEGKQLSEKEIDIYNKLDIYFGGIREQRRITEFFVSIEIYTPVIKQKENIDGTISLSSDATAIIANTDIQQYINDNHTSFARAFNDGENEYIGNFNGGVREATGQINKYLNLDGSINTKKADDDGVDVNSIKSSREEIDYKKDIIKAQLIEKNNIAQKTAIMECCFNAISQFFDTTNDNGENFADNFKFDVNKDINFDGNTISMKGQIGSNHIGLYYDLNSGNLYFDKFIDYNQDKQCYVIGEKNNRKEYLNINLPTLNQMYETSNKIDYKDILSDENIDGDMDKYEESLTKRMGDRVRNNCFENTDIIGKKMMVEMFNERNLLRQDILKSIYSMFYGISDVEELFGSSLEISHDDTKQYNLIDLIAKSIENCKSSFELLRFRNDVAKLHQYIMNKDIVGKDQLLSYLFMDNINTDNDTSDISTNAIGGKNPKNTQNKFVKSESDTEGNLLSKSTKDINYYTFLNLLSKGDGEHRYIDLDTFDDVLRVINTEGKYLVDISQGCFFENYYEQAMDNNLPYFKKNGNEYAQSGQSSNLDQELEEKLSQI